MTIAHLTNTCPSCGAEESLDALLLRMIDDDQVRKLIADILCKSMSLGGLVVRYLRLHKPAAQRLRMARVAALLGELVPDITRGAITRKGAEWAAPVDSWKAAFAIVFDGADEGKLKLPLDGNAYLYQVLMNHADRAAGAAEAEQEAARRHGHRTAVHGAQPVADLIHQAAAKPMTHAADHLPDNAAAPSGPSRAAQALKAANAAALARRAALSDAPAPDPVALPPAIPLPHTQPRT